jgi:GGDEF domain-containing protein
VSEVFLDPRNAERLTRATRAAQTLSETLWEALLQELTEEPGSQRVVELSAQLREVVAIVASLTRVGETPVTPEERPVTFEERPVMSKERPVMSKERPVMSKERPVMSKERLVTSEERPVTFEERPVTSEGREPHIMRVRDEPAADEAATDEEPLRPEPPAEPVEPEPRVARARTYGEPFSVQPAPPGELPETQASPSPAVLIDELALTVAATHAQAGPQIEIRDVRREEGPSAWIGSIGRRLERYERDAAPFAVLLVELVQIERLRHAEPVGEVSRLTAQIEDALARELRPADSLTSESPGRYWLLALQTDGLAAQMLAERIARAVRSSVSHRGTPLEVATGIAVCPNDGLKASELAAHADVALYAARAARRSSVR